MAGARRKKRKVKHLGDLGLSDPLQAVPMPEPGVEAKADRKDLLQLRRRFEPAGRVYRWISRRFGHKHDVRVNLDERGTYFWRAMDGRRTVGQIASALAAEYAVAGADARQAVVEFVKMLITRRLVFLAVPNAPHADRAEGR